MGSILPSGLMIPVSDEKATTKGVSEGGEEAKKHATNGVASAPLCVEKGIRGEVGSGEHVRSMPGIRGVCVARLRMVDMALRSAVVAFMVVSMSAMFTSTQHSQVRIIGFTIPVSMRWNRSQPFEFLVVVEALICGYALVQFVCQSVVLSKKVAPTRRRMWVQLAADQVCAYLVLAAAAAAAGASRTNKSSFRSLGVQNIHVPGVCAVLDKFCNRATIAIVFTLLAALASGTSAALDVYLLTLTY